MPDPELLKGKSVNRIPLDTLLRRLSQRITLLLDRGHQLGHRYFLGVTDIATLHFSSYRRAVPLLEAYFHSDAQHPRAVLSGQFVRVVTVDTTTQAALGDVFDPNTPR